MSDNVQLERDDDIAILTLNRPPANAMDLEFLDDLQRNIGKFASDDDTRGLVVTGAGDCFCAGLDLKQVLPV